MDQNYKTLIVAGIGGVGKGLFTLGENIFQNFEKIIAIDKHCRKVFFRRLRFPVKFFKGDLNENHFLENVLKKIKHSAILINVCSDIDTVKLRRKISQFNLAYIDAGASSIDTDGDCFTKLMPYTNKKCHDGKPHLICQGINPGMVEIVTALEIQKLRQQGASKFDITIFEYDSLKSRHRNGRFAVGWNVNDFVEEMVQLPGLECQNGKLILNNSRGGREGFFTMDGEKLICRVIGHEDIWNLAMIEGVKNVRFCYALNRDIMNWIKNANTNQTQPFYVPGEDEEIYGNDKIVVKVKSLDKNVSSSMLWQVNHNDIWQRYRLNGVVFQTCKSLMFSLKLLLDGHINQAGTYQASNLGIDRVTFGHLCDNLGIDWVHIGRCFASFKGD